MLSERNKAQSKMLDDENLQPEDLSFNINEKENLIKELSHLDEGFDEVFNRIKDVVTANPGDYADEITRLKELIKEITAIEATLRAQEAKNFEKAKVKFASVKKQVKTVKTSSRAVSNYYKSAMDLSGNRMDHKK
ncbi:MAG: flagellar protein FliT [Lachnospiraceae bacterium]|nr:flagellar protein FliT [Lachnospiraceae bacterium]